MKVDVLAIRKLQKKKGIRGKDLANMIGIYSTSLSTINRTGKCHPATAIAIADALGVDLDEIRKD